MITLQFFKYNMMLKTSLYILFIFLFTASLAAQESASPKAFKIALGNNSVPWNWQEHNQHKGILIDIINEALVSRMKIKVELLFYPWKRAQQMVKYNKADALITNFTEERKIYSNAGEHYITNIKRMIFVNKNDPLINDIAKAQSLKDLKMFTIGNNIGNPWAARVFKGYKIAWASSVSRALKMLEKSRFNIFIGNSVATRYKLKQLNITNVVMLPNQLIDIKASRYQLLIGKKSSYLHLLPEFDRTILAMKEDGSLQAIFDKYK
ncbi:substrate-binding periplasmic protein [Colwellia sp. TT2012]|uniref:substrate-binding periplasmic protein n=1 Tax=Colwellia sp. TT2012 TaxID=1720342 RepID=UPI00070E2BF8|nr:transporter substrate-binding domain-containing protein [Colwellia sp. TT2012]